MTNLQPKLLPTSFFLSPLSRHINFKMCWTHHPIRISLSLVPCMMQLASFQL